VPGTVGISDLADRILSWVQYPESACECGARPVTSLAKASLATAMAEPTSTSIDRSGSIANAEAARCWSYWDVGPDWSEASMINIEIGTQLSLGSFVGQLDLAASAASLAAIADFWMA
jgi:hypothetical protein